MSRLESMALAVVMLVLGAFLLGGRLAPVSLAVEAAPDESDIVLVLDFSASILEDAANRDRFAAALDRIADRIDATSSDLVAGDTTVTLVQFATRAADYPGCVDLGLLGSPATVARFADCLREAAVVYRTGLDPALTTKIGIDTNYVAAMTVAARHLPADAVRPALILFTDGKHDVAGVPISQVQPARDRLFGSRSPFALLPVGMGLSAAERDALESGLANLRIIREMPACVSGAQFDWPQVVFESPDDAGNAVAVALQNVTCTFTVAPTPGPTPTPTPTPEPPSLVRGIGLTPGDGRIEVAWSAPLEPTAPIVDYRVRCRSGDGEWIESGEGTSLETSTVVEGLTNGSAYECEVAVVDAISDGPFKAAPSTATPIGRPAAPAKPSVSALDRAVRIEVPEVEPALVSEYRFECSADQGTTWPAQVQVASSGVTATEIGSLTNGVDYVCRAFATNAAGTSDPSVVSDAVRPCGSLVECNPIALPIVGLLGLLAGAGLLAALVALYREGRRGYVVAVVDVVHTTNLGNGSKLGIGFVRDGPRGEVSGIVADPGRKAEIRIRQRRGDRFEVTDRANRQVTGSGESLVVIDSRGVRHQVILRRFSTATASAASTNR
ncbi:MAG: fibronectin type III domain-containing protein [Chloroflexota bacterium]